MLEEGRIGGKSECESRLKGGESCIGSLTKKGGGHVWLRWDGYGGVGAYVASGGMRGIVGAARIGVITSVCGFLGGGWVNIGTYKRGGGGGCGGVIN